MSAAAPPAGLHAKCGAGRALPAAATGEVLTMEGKGGQLARAVGEPNTPQQVPMWVPGARAEASAPAMRPQT